MNYAALAMAFCGVSAGFHLGTLAIAAKRLLRPQQHSVRMGSRLPPVSLVIPLCGIDNFAPETLSAAFRIDYPEYEILFCAAAKDDPVVPLAERMIAANPEIGARLLIGDHRISGNPKLNNVVKGWNAARHAWIVMADSNVLMPRDYLRRLVARWRDDTGVVCSMPIGARPYNFWAELECAFLNTLQARYQYVSESVGFGFAQGKSMLFRRDIIERASGIRALAADNAEDAAATKLVRSVGLRVHLVDMPFEQPLGWRTAGAVWSRQLRWARLRRASFPVLFAPELLVGAAFPTLAAIIAAINATGGDWASAVATVAVLLLAWFGAELGLAYLAGWRCSRRLALALLVRDLLLPALWVAALLGRDFEWRGNAMTAEKRTPQQPAEREDALPADGLSGSI